MGKKHGKPEAKRPAPEASPKSAATEPGEAAAIASFAGDGDLVKLALSGKLRQAAREAVRDQRARGLAVTFKRGDQIVRRSADGTIEVIGRVTTPAFRLPEHVRKIGR